MEALYGAGWENRPEVIAAYRKLLLSNRFYLQGLIDCRAFDEIVALGLLDEANELIEAGKLTPHGRV